MLKLLDNLTVEEHKSKKESPMTYRPKGSLFNEVGARGFEPPTSCTPSKRAIQVAPRPDRCREFIGISAKKSRMDPRNL